MQKCRQTLAIFVAMQVGSCGVEDSPHLSSTSDLLGSFEEFRGRTYKEPWEGGSYIVEGDIPIHNDADLLAYWETFQPGALVVRQANGVDLRWSNSAKTNLSYCIDNSFGANTQKVRWAMESASREWEKRGAVNFVHNTAYDGAGCTNSNNNVVFNVRQNFCSSNCEYAARAFLPNSGRSDREILITTGTLGNLPGGLTGVLGHELGHALGFGHEHVRPELYGACSEPGEWRALTTYDPLSIMHYPQCNPFFTAGFTWWSGKDRDGIAPHYGAGFRGYDDILWRHSTGSIAVWTMYGSNIITYGPGHPVGSEWAVSGFGDFDGNEKSDILWRASNGQMAIWFMNGVSKVGEAYPGAPATAWQILGVGDFDGDDRSDILWRHTDSTTAIWFMNGGTKVAEAYPGSWPSNWQFQGINDFNGDGMSDILWRDTNGALRIWLMSAGSKIGDNSPGAPGNDWKVAGLGDFNGDVRSDILWRHDNGTLAIWFINATTKTGEAYPGTVGNEWQIRGVGDFNGDWKSDILWRATSGTPTPPLAMWFMDGGAKVGEGYPAGPPDSSWAIVGTSQFD